MSTPANGLERFVLHSEPSVSIEAGLKALLAFEGKVTCEGELFVIKIPIGGPIALIIGGQLPVGVGVELGGKMPSGKGFFYPPTVLSNVPETADCVGDEIFGPVAALQTFTDQEDVIRRANDTEYGLVAYVFSEDMKRAMQVCERLDYGMVGLNRGLVSDPAAPFGGTKQSGLGREGGHEGMLEFMETQYISACW